MKPAWILCLLGAVALSVAAFEVAHVSEEIPEAGTFTRTQVTDGKTMFSFIAPNDWVASMDAGKKLYSLNSSKLEGTFNLRLLTNGFPASAAKFKELAIASYSDATVTDEFTASCASGGGLGLDIRHVVAGKFSMNSKVAIFPAPDGSVEVSLSTPNSDLSSFHSVWVSFLNSVRVESRSPAK